MSCAGAVRYRKSAPCYYGGVAQERAVRVRDRWERGFEEDRGCHVLGPYETGSVHHGTFVCRFTRLSYVSVVRVEGQMEEP